MAEPGLGEGGLINPLGENEILKEVKKEAPAEQLPVGLCGSCNKRARFFLHSPVGFSCQCDAEWECNDFGLCGEKCKGLYWDVSFIGGSKAAVGGRDECGSCGSKIIFDTVFKVTALDANGLATARKVKRSSGGHLEGWGGGGCDKMQKKKKKKKKKEKTEQHKAVAASIAEALDGKGMSAMDWTRFSDIWKLKPC